MASKSLVEKMKLKPDSRAAIINAPDGYMSQLGELPNGVRLSQTISGEYDWIEVFVKHKADLDKIAPMVIGALKPEGLLWVCFPKGTSKEQRDLTRDKGWDAVRELKWITLIAIDDTWSAFSLRPYKPGEARQTFRI